MNTIETLEEKKIRLIARLEAIEHDLNAQRHSQTALSTNWNRFRQTLNEIDAIARDKLRAVEEKIVEVHHK